MTAEERAEKKKEKAETELRRQVNREVRKRKLVPLDTTKTKKAKTTKGAAATSKKSGGKKKDASDKHKKIRTYFGHVPRPAEDGGSPALPALPPGGWATSNREERIQAARRAAEYYGRMAKAWEDIAQEEEEGELQEDAAQKLPALNFEEGKVDNISDKPADVGYASASEGYAADESEAV